jgi:hypothetical protein
VAIITRELADKIAKKLRAQIRSKGKAHDYALVYHGGKLIASFGIRQGSKKSLGHDHVPGRLYISQSKTSSVARPMPAKTGRVARDPRRKGQALTRCQAAPTAVIGLRVGLYLGS